MKTSRYVFGLMFFLMGIFGCSDDESESIENVRETLIGSTWIQESLWVSGLSGTFVVNHNNKYDFYENGEFRVTGLFGFPLLFNDTLKVRGNWEYDSESRIINFTNVNIMVNELNIFDREKLKILEINKDRFVAQPIYDQWEGNIIKEIYVRKVK